MVLGLVEQLFVNTAQRCVLLLGSIAETRSLELLLLLLLHVHDHLQIAEFLGSSKVIYSIDEGLFSHGHNLLADVLDYVVFNLFELVFLLPG